MTDRIFVRDLEIFSQLQTELSQFNSSANKVLDDVAQNTIGVKEHLNSRSSYWNIELRRREGALRACQLKGDGYRGCLLEIAAVREANIAIEKLKRLSAKLEEAIGEYQPHSNRLRKTLDGKIGKARRDLQHSVEKYRQYLDQDASGSSASGPVSNSRIASNIDVPSVNTITSKPGITWAEHQAILNKWLTGIISLEELQKLGQPISDLKAMTLAEDYSGLEQLLESEQFYDITRGSWEADNLRDAILATLKIINYWRSKS
ncbi:MAG: hypothetical protein ABIU06_15660 [Anaerolineales bacterium]